MSDRIIRIRAASALVRSGVILNYLITYNKELRKEQLDIQALDGSWHTAAIFAD